MKMADNNFKTFYVGLQLENIDAETWESLNIYDWYELVYNKILKSNVTFRLDSKKHQ